MPTTLPERKVPENWVDYYKSEDGKTFVKVIKTRDRLDVITNAKEGSELLKEIEQIVKEEGGKRIKSLPEKFNDFVQQLKGK